MNNKPDFYQIGKNMNCKSSIEEIKEKAKIIQEESGIEAAEEFIKGFSDASLLSEDEEIIQQKTR